MSIPKHFHGPIEFGTTKYFQWLSYCDEHYLDVKSGRPREIVRFEDHCYRAEARERRELKQWRDIEMFVFWPLVALLTILFVKAIL